MVVCVDKATAVSMYDKVRVLWRAASGASLIRPPKCGEQAGNSLDQAIEYMQSTDMAVVVWQGQNEVDEFRRKGLDIASTAGE